MPKISDQPKDFLLRRKIIAQLMHGLDIDSFQIKKYQGVLPEGWEISDKTLKLPIGMHESYFVNGKEYNALHDRDIEEQKKLIHEDLKKEGFSDTEIEELIKSLTVNDWRPLTLDFDESYKRIHKNPELEKRIKNVFGELNKIYQEHLSRFKIK